MNAEERRAYKRDWMRRKRAATVESRPDLQLDRLIQSQAHSGEDWKMGGERLLYPDGWSGGWDLIAHKVAEGSAQCLG